MSAISLATGGAGANAIQQRRVHIVVTCTNRKTTQVPQELRLGNLSERGIDRRFAAWIYRVAHTSVPTVNAIDLYAGEYWQIARTLPTLVQQPTTLWVCSAGYGLVNANTPIKPYAATFAIRQTDSVASSKRGVREWWKRLTNWSGTFGSEPRSLADLALRDPQALIIAILSEPYLRACAEDLTKAASFLANSEQLSVIGPATPGSDVSDLIVPVTARLRPAVGGTLVALNARAAARVLTAAAATGNLHRSALQEVMKEALAAAPPASSLRRPGQRLSDDEVRSFIRHQVAAGSTQASTALLRRLRQSGKSCEQSRFRRLFAEVTREVVR